MKRAYKEIANDILQNYHLTLASNGVAYDEQSFRAMQGGILGLYIAATASGDLEALAELKVIYPKELGEDLIKPYLIEELA
ncbi:DUF4754 family protein [Escherichia coli]|uniref:Uncharacterized protein n=3 Tax=Escherichia coli TaxID=562 RepID=A0AAD2JRA7_ECOLX|nr:hypothetical protein [Escherichia coli]EFN8406237.1 hypothetical protein [Escherichia coli O15]EEV5549719.1 hypothetical protein [Escherichia coli]EEW2347508.1 hypothetical protein [Escherichia coli]EFA7485324.1 hypothetical protein [Escherichia coli]EFN8159358.1 hypothetical protein [Escherichia coli]